MILYHGSGATDYEPGIAAMPQSQWLTIKESACRLMALRNQRVGADFLRAQSFAIIHATNNFRDEFEILRRVVPLEEYVTIEEWHRRNGASAALFAISGTLLELGHGVRMIVVDPAIDNSVGPVSSPNLMGTSAAVERALDDAQQLMIGGRAVSAVDRIHTALHGYLRHLCIEAGIVAQGASTETAPALLTSLCNQHPLLVSTTPYADDVRRTLRCFGGAIESLGQFRNRGSVAHPNSELLDEAEAMLAINATRTMLHYIAAKLQPAQGS